MNIGKKFVEKRKPGKKLPGRGRLRQRKVKLCDAVIYEKLPDGSGIGGLTVRDPAMRKAQKHIRAKRFGRISNMCRASQVMFLYGFIIPG